MWHSFLQMFALPLVIAVAGWILGGWLATTARLALDRARIDRLVRNLVVSLIRPVVFAVALVAALQQAGLELTGLVAVIGASTLAIGLALRDSLANVAAGALLITQDPFDAGDSIEAGGQTGTVLKLTLMNTVLKTPQGAIVSVPNTLVQKNPLKNLTRNGMRRADLTLRVKPDSNLAQVREVFDACCADPRVLKDPPPIFLVQEVNAHGIDLLLGPWFSTADFGAGRSDFVTAMRDGLQKAKIGLGSHAAVVVASQP